MCALTAREAGMVAGVLNDNGRIKTEGPGSWHPYRAGIYIGTGIADTPRVIEIYNQVHAPETTEATITVKGVKRKIYGEDGKPKRKIRRDYYGKAIENMRENTRRLSMALALGVFPEQVTGDTARILGLQGPAGSSVEACATGAGNIIEAYEKIKSGKADVTKRDSSCG